MFYGSDTHAEAAAAIFSVIASCRLHTLDPFQYLEEVLRVLPYWTRDRYLELSPKYWRATRGRLRAEELAMPISAFEVPPPLGESAAISADASPSLWRRCRIEDCRRDAAVAFALAAGFGDDELLHVGIFVTSDVGLNVRSAHRIQCCDRFPLRYSSSARRA